MTAIAESVTPPCEATQRESVTDPTGRYEFEELFAEIEEALGDIAEIVNENFILEVEASRRVAE